jgi:endo-1,4-beta-xylanase
VGFDDVAQDSYWYDAILSAKSAGIVNGYGESFMPYSSIKRQDAAVMVYRALMSEGKIEDVSFDLSEYNDAQSISSYASEAVATLSAMGILNGSNGSFRPNDAITRAEAAVLIYRVMNL